MTGLFSPVSSFWFSGAWDWPQRKLKRIQVGYISKRAIQFDGILECKKDSLRTYVVNLKHECKSNKLSVEHLTSIQEEADVYASTSLEKSNIRQYPQPWHRCNGAGTWKIASLWMALWQASLNSTVSSIWLTRRSTCGIPRIPCITWKWSNGYHIMWKVQSLVLEYLKENA